MDYNAIGFLKKDIYEERGACILQMFEVTTVFNGIEYQLEITESIELSSGKGDIFGSLCYEMKEGDNKYDFSLSFDSEQHDNADEAELKHIYGKSVVAQLVGAIVGVFEHSEAVAERFTYARYFNQKGIYPK